MEGSPAVPDNTYARGAEVVPPVRPVTGSERVQRRRGRDEGATERTDQRGDRAPAEVDAAVEERRALEPADPAPVPERLGPVVAQRVVLDGLPMSFVDVRSTDGRLAAERTDFEARVLSFDEERAKDPMARSPFATNRFRPTAPPTMVEAGAVAVPPDSPAGLARGRFIAGDGPVEAAVADEHRS